MNKIKRTLSKTINKNYRRGKEVYDVRNDICEEIEEVLNLLEDKNACLTFKTNIKVIIEEKPKDD